jgi:hypothetical protein
METVCVQGPGAEGRGALLHVHSEGLHHLRQGQLPGAAAKNCCDSFSCTSVTLGLLLANIFGKGVILREKDYSYSIDTGQLFCGESFRLLLCACCSRS